MEDIIEDLETNGLGHLPASEFLKIVRLMMAREAKATSEANAARSDILTLIKSVLTPEQLAQVSRIVA